MRVFGLLVCAALAACNAPVMEMKGARSAQVDANGMAFNVFFTANQAEAHRTNFSMRPDGRQVFTAARLAIQEASGCFVDESSWEGDVALVKVELHCGKPRSNVIEVGRE